MADCGQSRFIGLNVGGLVYFTTLGTLRSNVDSTLGRMFSGNFQKKCEKDKAGNFLVDADGPLFRYVLGFMRHGGRLDLPKDFKDMDLLESEAEFYQNRQLTEAVKKYRAGAEVARIHFVVGGECFTELRSTLMKNEQFVKSHLGGMVDDASTKVRFEINKDAASFRHLWRFILTGSLDFDISYAQEEIYAAELVQLREDLPFYDVEGLRNAIEAQLSDIYAT
ncbi:uncharacterized protein LOC119737151 [Patiria miniata]|uniref:BTB domain-containing protein n=1 Tax=Patiria miniata TaxID=46514 RepID=A0A914AU45_PATMI|nr:uncharacterized protein LOC119737151 [Patiria miniata]